MAKHKGEFTLTFKFEGKDDPYDPGWIDWDLTKIKLGGVEVVDPDVTAEHWAQSDRYWVDICNAIITAMCNGKAKL